MGQGRDNGYLERNTAMRMETRKRVGEVLREIWDLVPVKGQKSSHFLHAPFSQK